jgi:hypothetical protein
MKKLLIGTSCTILTLLALLFVFILYPNNLFARRTVHKEFTIYADHPTKGDYKAALDKAITLIKTSELYDSKYHYDIFLTQGTFYKDVIFKLFGPGPARSQDNNILLNIPADFEQDLLIGPKTKRDLTSTIAHEAIHCLQFHKYGFRSIPTWKKEGYPEYVARQGEGDFCTNVRRLSTLHDTWMELKPGHFDQLVYFKGRLMIEYLIRCKGMTYDQILDDAIQEDEVYHEMMQHVMP